ncbi:MAG: flagellar biosynthesis regulator FlhF [Desulfobacteraceae bacterium 4484_190.1]|nr:MAG: flagellar biosynthesis regulator FlhF [Desulfobacteraceae bacterium 4484_190.1]
MLHNPLAVYQKVENATMSGREVEAAVLTKAALKLKKCQNNWDADDREIELDAALKFNQRIWTIFQGELIKEENPLPINFKRDILSLSAFVDKRIFETMAYPEPDKLTVMININNNLAAGLRSAPAATK